MRLQITFSKTEAMRFTSHLDLFRAWERTLRRAGLPLAYSQGFKAHPRLNLASALPLGFTSSGEVLEAWLEEEMPLEIISQAIRSALPPGLLLGEIRQAGPKAPSLQTQLQAAEYNVTLLQNHPELDSQLRAIVAAASLPRERRGKAYDLRPLIGALRRLSDAENGCQRIFMRLSAQENATGRPEEVLLSAGIDPLSARIHRTRLVFAE
jgi:radical SAM-linked protein